MIPFKDILQWEIRTGDPIIIHDDALGDVTITPQSQALTIRWPYRGWVWNRPLAIWVAHGTQTERMPIMDVTRVVQLGSFGVSLIFSFFILLQSVRGRRR